MIEPNAREFTGRKALALIVSGFAIIIGVNLTLAFKAVSTFPGLEVKNSYVASQSFDQDRAAQLQLGWEVSAQLDGEMLVLSIMDQTGPVKVEILSAVLGRPTHVASDSHPDFVYTGTNYAAPIELDPGNWNLRLVAKAANGTIFRQRINVESPFR